MKKFIVLFFLVSTSALAINDGRWDNIDPLTKKWFESVKSPHGVPCCSVADGHVTSWEIREDGHYWVPIEGKWYLVPSESVVKNAGNPFNQAVVWYTKQGDEIYYIRCFVPSSEI